MSYDLYFKPRNGLFRKNASALLSRETKLQMRGFFKRGTKMKTLAFTSSFNFRRRSRLIKTISLMKRPRSAKYNYLRPSYFISEAQPEVT